MECSSILLSIVFVSFKREHDFFYYLETKQSLAKDKVFFLPVTTSFPRKEKIKKREGERERKEKCRWCVYSMESALYFSPPSFSIHLAEKTAVVQPYGVGRLTVHLGRGRMGEKEPVQSREKKKRPGIKKRKRKWKRERNDIRFH